MPPSETWSENYMLIASGPGHYAPFLAGWQEFKDNLRKIVEYQPGWTNVASGPRNGEMQGWCRLDRKTDADAAYTHYSSSRGILVHLFKTYRNSSDYRLIKCNCSYHFPETRDHSSMRSGIDAGGVNSYMSRIYSGPVQQYVVSAPPAYSYPGYPQHVAYAATPTYSMQPAQVQYATPQIPMYSTGTGGMPVNVGGGAMLTEARGIFIKGLNYQAKPNDVNALLSKVAIPVEVKLHKDSRSGQFRGSATAKFATKEEAMAVVNTLEKTVHMGKVIEVRLDTERTVVGQTQGPVIVNGSNFARG